MKQPNFLKAWRSSDGVVVLVRFKEYKNKDWTQLLKKNNGVHESGWDIAPLSSIIYNTFVLPHVPWGCNDLGSLLNVWVSLSFINSGL